MLEKLRESTQALQGLTDTSPDELFVDKRQRAGPDNAPARRKKSRFLREDLTGGQQEEEEGHQVASRLANDILGIRNDSMGEYDKYRPEQSRTTSTNSRRYDFEDDSSLLPKTTSSRFVVDDDDTDALIQSLKQKTSRKHMSDILDEIEKSEPVVKFEPIPKFKDTFKLSPSPEPAASKRLSGANTLGRNKKLSSSSSYNNGDSYGLEGSAAYGGYGGSGPGGRYYDAGSMDIGGGGGQYGSLGRPQTKNYNQQYAQAAYGQPKTMYNSVDQQPLYYGSTQAAYGSQPVMYGAPDPYGQDLYRQGGYGPAAGSMQPRMAATVGMGPPADQMYGPPYGGGGYNPMGGGYGTAGGLYSPHGGEGGGYGTAGGLYSPHGGEGSGYGLQPNSRQQRHQMRQQMYNMGGGWQ
jgi:hypothetical protein